METELSVGRILPDTIPEGGVVVGVVLGIADDQLPLVAYPGGSESVKARSTVALGTSEIGSQVALMFEGGDLEKPIVMGKLIVPGVMPDVGAEASVANAETKVTDTKKDASARDPFVAEVDQESVVLSADKEIVLKCGKSSITLTRAGKIILSGAYVLSRSSGVNKLKGGSIQIN